MWPILILCAVAVAATAQGPSYRRGGDSSHNGYRTTTTPVPILRHVSRSNHDGSYTYGYEAADGTYKLETRAANGDVSGKYGFIDDKGKMRTVQYGANRHGFQPVGTDITVPPPTLVDETALERRREQERSYHRRPAESRVYQTQSVAVTRSQPQQSYSHQTQASPPSYSRPREHATSNYRYSAKGVAPISESTFKERFAEFDKYIDSLFET